MDFLNITYHPSGVTFGDSFVGLQQIINKCRLEAIKQSNYKLLKICWEETRNCKEIFETVVVTPEEIKIIKDSLVGKTIYFGEINGRHSDVYGEVDESEIEIIEDPLEVLVFLQRYPRGTDYNHSFIDQFIEKVLDGAYEDISKDSIKDLLEVSKRNYK